MTTASDNLPVVIVGSGQSGITLARELRKLAPDQAITLITADDGNFYPKPSLSTALVAGKTAEQLVLTPAATLAEQNRLDLITQTHVTRIDPHLDMLELENGKKVGYRALVLATGAHPIRPPLAGNAGAAVLSVNSLADYAAFRAQLKPGMRVAILGAGLIGCEFANDLAASGYGVDVFDPGTHALGRLLPPEAGQWLQTQLQTLDIRFHFGTLVQQVDTTDSGYLLTSQAGQQFQADLVLSAIGLASDTALAKAAGLTTQRGIVVNRQLQTNVPNIYALGDCAEVEGLVLPFIQPLMLCARTLAKTLAGTPTEVSYPAMPVMVKTPTCPTVVCPPPMGSQSRWQIDSNSDGLTARALAENDALLGFALLGAATQQKQALAAQLPNLL